VTGQYARSECGESVYLALCVAKFAVKMRRQDETRHQVRRPANSAVMLVFASRAFGNPIRYEPRIATGLDSVLSGAYPNGNQTPYPDVYI
jgi:hypothetical protein